MMRNRLRDKVVLVGISWFRGPEEYAAIRQLLTDPHALPPTYDAWLARAKQQQAKVEADGYTVVRVNLDPVEFPAWCKARNLNIDADARRRFAAEAAMRRFEHKDG